MKALFFNIPAQGHINPSLPVITEMVQRGEQVIYFNTEEFRKSIEATGATFQPYPNIDHIETMMADASAGNFALNAIALLTIAQNLLPFILEQISQHQPDYVIYDSLASWGSLAARVTGLPSVTFLTTFVFHPSAMPPLSLQTIREVVPALFNFVKVMPQYAGMRRQMRAKYPNTTMIGLTEALNNSGDLNIVFTAQEFQPASEKLSPTYKFVGASIMPRPHDDAFPFAQLKGTPLVYISLGTINNRQNDFYKLCFEAFGNHHGQFILSVGKRTDIEALGRIPDNFIVRQFVPQLEVLERVNAFITHGGLNSIHEGFYFGVPMVVIPQQLEQGMVALQTEKHGAGIVVRTPSVDNLRDALRRLLESPIYAQSSAQLGDSLRQAGGYQRAVDEILWFAQQKKSRA